MRWDFVDCSPYSPFFLGDFIITKIIMEFILLHLGHHFDPFTLWKISWGNGNEVSPNLELKKKGCLTIGHIRFTDHSVKNKVFLKLSFHFVTFWWNNETIDSLGLAKMGFESIYSEMLLQKYYSGKKLLLDLKKKVKKEWNCLTLRIKNAEKSGSIS